MNRNSDAKASIGETSASRTSAKPSQKTKRRQAGTGVPRRCSVRVRFQYRNAKSAAGTSCHGSSAQLVSSEGPCGPTPTWYSSTRV